MRMARGIDCSLMQESREYYRYSHAARVCPFNDVDRPTALQQWAVYA